MAKKKEITYNEGIIELNDIMLELENENLDMNTLRDKIKRAAYLIQLCKGQLNEIDEDVKKIFDTLD